MPVRTIAEDIADYLISLSLATGKNVDVFQGMLDGNSPDNAIFINEGGGAGAERSLDGARILNPGILIIVRRVSNEFNEGYDLAQRIYNAMLDLSNTAIGGRPYIGLNPLGDVSLLGRDEANRWKWAMNFVVKTVPV